MLLTHDSASARDAAEAEFGAYGRLPAYRPVIEREGVDSAADIAVFGDEAALTKAVERVRDAGVTDLQITPFGDESARRRTVELLITLR